ncbi:MAG: hypothetical protein WD944_04860 [Steroidobacteraceae bacterium]
MDAVVAQFQLRNPAAAALPFLEFEQVLIRAGRDRAQFVEGRIETRGDDAAIAQERRRRGDNRPR